MFNELIDIILNKTDDFKESTEIVRQFIDDMDIDSFKDIVRDIGIIPENIKHDSSEEKLYSKASDIVLAKCFRILGLASKALDGRADNADIIANSTYGYNYSLVADAKCFRLSRTARNQKDFKISNLSDWRGSENEYAILVAPYFQYPKKESQIYSKALESNVCLLSWEHISMLINHKITETENFSLESLWNSSQMIARDKTLSFANAKKSFLPKIDTLIAKKIGVDFDAYLAELNDYKKFIIKRGRFEISYWNEEIIKIKNYSKEQAIEELILSKKLNEKIYAISDYIKKLDD